MNFLRVDFDFGDLATTETAELLGATLVAEFSFPAVGPAGATGPQGEQGEPGSVSGTLAWTNVTDKPTNFPPSSHTHVAADVTDFAAAVAAVSPPVDWNSLTGKPATFAPSAHTHPISDVTNLQTALDGKAASSHTHAANQVTDFNTAAAAAAPVQSVAGRTGAVTLAVADVSGAVASSDSRLTDARQPTLHSSTHHTGGTDAIAPSSIGAQSLVSSESLTLTADVQLSANRNRRYTVVNFSGSLRSINLPTSGHLVGDIVQIFQGAGTNGVQVTVNGIAFVGNPDISSGQQQTFLATGTAANNWALARVDTHTHTGSQVTVGTTANLPLITGTNGVIEAGAFGTSAASFCEGNDARLSDDRDPNLHAASHLPDGADEIFDQSLNSADSPTFAKITISGDEINGTAGAIHYRYASSDPISNEATPYFAVESFDQDTEARVGFAILGVRADKGFIQAENADFRIEQNGGSLANINMANAKLVDEQGPYTATIDVQEQLTDDVTLTIPDQSGTLAVVTDIPTTAGDVGAVAAGSITTSGLTQATARILGRTSSSTGAVEEIQIGSGLSLSAGELSATGGSGVTAVGATLADILSVSGSDLVADDLAADKLYGWDDSESKAIGYSLSGLVTDGTTLQAAKVDVYTANDTWNKPAGAKLVHFHLIGGGAGGGAGRRGATSTNRGGGGGGGAGRVTIGYTVAAALGSSVTVTVGSGGTGASDAADDTNGDAGTNGGETSFGSDIIATGGLGGGGGTDSAGGAGGATGSNQLQVYGAAGSGLGAGGAGATSGGSGTAGGSPSNMSGAGGGGGGNSISNTNTAGGQGGAGGTVGQANNARTAGPLGNSGAAGTTSVLVSGTGGAGGRTFTPWAGAAGANGGDYGGGGGGGSAALNAAGGSSAGGNGGGGVCIITTYF
jgi:hypothetical protein